MNLPENPRRAGAWPRLHAAAPLLLAATAALALAGCKDAPSSAQPQGSQQAAPAAAAPLSIEAVESQARGFSVGSAMSARTVYVFFDAQCPHCAALWEAARPLKSQARFVWIPVGLLNEKSTTQGATLLAAPDPAAAMDSHEASLRGQQGGIAPGAAIDTQKATVAANTRLFDGFGFASVPTVVGKHAQSGELVKLEGSMPTAALAQALGLQVPASGS